MKTTTNNELTPAEIKEHMECKGYEFAPAASINYDEVEQTGSVAKFSTILLELVIDAHPTQADIATILETEADKLMQEM